MVPGVLRLIRKILSQTYRITHRNKRQVATLTTQLHAKYYVLCMYVSHGRYRIRFFDMLISFHIHLSPLMTITHHVPIILYIQVCA
jgi:hypothetical protein